MNAAEKNQIGDFNTQSSSGNVVLHDPIYLCGWTWYYMHILTMEYTELIHGYFLFFYSMFYQDF